LWNQYNGVLIGIPIIKLVSFEWALMFRRLQAPLDTSIVSNKGVPIDVAREQIVKSFKESSKEWLFFLDSDVYLEENALMKMIQKQYPILSGLYCTRYPPIEPCCWRITENGRRPIKFNYGDIVEAEAGGAGCLLIHRSVFDKIEPPYFEWSVGKRPEKFESMSEDFYFFRKIREHGFKFLVDTSIQCKHDVNQVVNATGAFEFLAE